MRVSDRSTARSYLKYLNKAKSEYAKTNLQVASGNRFTKISDDVSAGTRVMSTRMDKAKAEKHLDNVSAISDEMSVSEDAMKAASALLTRTHEMLVKSMSEDKGETGRLAVANEISALKKEMLQLMNTKYDKNYSFGGSNSSPVAPFSLDANGNIEYNGIPVNDIQKDADGSYYYMNGGAKEIIPMDEDVYLDVGFGIPLSKSQLDGESGFKISFSGLDVFGFGKNADGLPNNIYNVLNEAEQNLRNYDEKKLGEVSTHLNETMDVFTGNITDMGAKTQLLETMETRLKDRVFSYKERINGLMGTNYEEAAIDEKMNDFVLKAVLQMGAKILPVTLMDFLR